MRITPNERSIIIETAAQVFGAATTVWLFGSRVDDAAKGGDVDLLVKLEMPVAHLAALVMRYNALLQMKLGLQKIDILVVDPSTTLKPIHQHALTTAIRL